MELGLFDIMQVDPTDQRSHGEVYRQRLRDIALAEELGFDSYFVSELHFTSNFRSPAASVWLAAASQITSRMRLGVMAYTLPIKAPAQLAEDIAVLDWLSSGRIEVGLGLGHRTEELEALGIDPAERVPVFQERAAVLQALWTGGQVTVDSATTTIKGASMAPVPLQQPNPPLWYAGSDTDAAAWVGSIGFSLALGFRKTEELRPAASAFKAAVDARTKAEPARVLPGEGRLALMRQVYVAESDDAALEEMSDDIFKLFLQNGGPDRPIPPRDEARRVVDRLIADDIFVAGSPQSIVEQIETLRSDLGIDVFLANVYANGLDQERIDRTLRLLATEVKPRL
ncbi:MAG: LLM class flavin-dependent oxidoreductase, partial [Thermomicrobiales bacterium]